MSVEPKMKIVPRNPTAFPCNSSHVKLKNTGSERGSEKDKESSSCEGKRSRPGGCGGAGQADAVAQTSLSNADNVANSLTAQRRGQGCTPASQFFPGQKMQYIASI